MPSAGARPYHGGRLIGAKPIATQARIDPAALDALFAPFDRTDAPGVAVGVALNGRPGYRRGFGMASVAPPVALSPSTPMRIGSIIKQFTAMAVLLLAEEGHLSLDESPRRRVPDLLGWADAISLRQLLGHTSGMRDGFDILLHCADTSRPLPADVALRLLATLDSVNFAPGAGWSYNNAAYSLLGEVVARASGRPFGDVLRERIFAPLGMAATLLCPSDEQLPSDSATPHVPAAAGGWRRGAFGLPIGGEGGVASTVDDILRWLAHMDAPAVGTAASWAELCMPLSTHGYALGLYRTRHRGLDTLHHAGAVVGGASRMLKVLGHRLDIVVTSNGRSGLDVHALVEAVVDRCIPGLPPAPVSAAGEPLSGRFHSAATGRTLSLVPLDREQDLCFGATTVPALRGIDGALSVPLLSSDLEVRPLEGGDVLEVTEFGAADRLARLVPPPPTAPPVGRYESAAAELTATISAPDTGPALLIEGPVGALGYALEPIGPDLWEATSTGPLPLAATLEVDADGFRFSTARTFRLRFTHCQ